MPKYAEQYRKLRRVLIMITLLVALVPLIILNWRISQNYEKYYYENITKKMQQMVDIRKDVITLFLAEQRSFLSVIINLYGFNYLKDQANLERTYEVLQKKAALVDIGVLNEKGFHTAYSGPYRDIVLGKDYSNEDWFKEVMVKGVHISDVYLGYRNIPHFTVAIASPDRKWILRSTLDSEMFNRLVSSARIGERGDAYIVNRMGVFQTPGRFENIQLFPEERALLYFHEGTKVKELTAKGHSYLYATSWINNNQWVLVVKADTKSELAPFYKARTVDKLVMLIGAIFIISSAVLIVNKLVNRIERADRERARYNEQMVHMDKMAAIGRLAAGIAHEVNNPLAVIGEKAGWMQDLLSDENPAGIKGYDEFKDAIEKIKFHIKRAKTVTHRLLGFSRKVDGAREPADLNHLLEEAVSFLEKELAYRGIKIVMDLDPSLPLLEVNPSEMEQVFLNILDNAVDSMSKGGEIRAATSSNGGRVAVTISDQGDGIPPGHIDKIFEPFFTTKTVGKGTGLGLSVSYTLIQKAGGDIKVSSEPGKGTSFTILLPVRPPAALEAAGRFGLKKMRS